MPDASAWPRSPPHCCSPPPPRADLPAGNLVVQPRRRGRRGRDGQLDAGGAAAGLDARAVRSPPVAYGAPAFPTAEDGTRLGGGRNFFAGGPDGDVNTASQVIDVSARRAGDRRRAASTATLSALIGGYSSQDDAATVSARAARRGRRGVAAPTTLRPVRRPSARASRTCCRARRGRDPRGHALDPRHDHRHAHAGQLQRRLRRQRQLQLRRAAGRGAERRARRRSRARCS